MENMPQSMAKAMQLAFNKYVIPQPVRIAFRALLAASVALDPSERDEKMFGSLDDVFSYIEAYVRAGNDFPREETRDETRHIYALCDICDLYHPYGSVGHGPDSIPWLRFTTEELDGTHGKGNWLICTCPGDILPICATCPTHGDR